LIGKDDVVIIWPPDRHPYSMWHPGRMFKEYRRQLSYFRGGALPPARARVMNMSTSEINVTSLRVPIDDEHRFREEPILRTKIGAEKMTEIK
jgi:hypothetical protein